MVWIQFAKQKNLNLGPCLFFVAIETCGEHLGVVENKTVLLIEEIDDVTKRITVLDDATFGMNDHQTAFIAMEVRTFFSGGKCRGILCQTVFGQFVLELREFHIVFSNCSRVRQRSTR